MPLALLSASFQSLPPLPTIKFGLLVLIPVWVGLCTFWDPVGLSNKLSCEAESFSRYCLNRYRSFKSEAFEVLFTWLDPWPARPVSVPSCFFPVYLHTNVGPPSPPAPTLPLVLSTQPPISAPPTGLDERFFFNSLVIVLPYFHTFLS